MGAVGTYCTSTRSNGTVSELDIGTAAYISKNRRSRTDKSKKEKEKGKKARCV